MDRSLKTCVCAVGVWFRRPDTGAGSRGGWESVCFGMLDRCISFPDTGNSSYMCEELQDPFRVVVVVVVVHLVLVLVTCLIKYGGGTVSNIRKALKI